MMSSPATAIFHGVEVPETLLAAEMQNHRAASLADARARAGRALAAKAVLIDRARHLNIAAVPERNVDGLEETQEEAMIRELLSQEVEAEAPSADAVRHIYDSQPDGFRTPPLLEASHILVAPEQDDDMAATMARARADELISVLSRQPDRFGGLARTVSACPSGSDGGTLGQLRPGDLLPAIWQALLTLDPGKIADEPIRTEHGWHVLRLDHRVEGRRLPFEHVAAHIEMQLEARAWTLAAARYVEALLNRASASAPALGISALGTLETNQTPDKRVFALIGDVFSHPEAALAALKPEIVRQIDAEAENTGRSAASVLSDAINCFLNEARDEAWTQVISRLRDSPSPLSDCLETMVRSQLPQVKASRTLILTHRKGAVNPEEKGEPNGTGL
jgi:peptidyl-prolyl cis-trans isomerase C